MGLGYETVQNLIELKKLGHFENFQNVVEFGSQELHLSGEDFKEILDRSGYKDTDLSLLKNIDNWPKQPRCPAKPFYEMLGFKEYYSFDINKKFNSISHDFNEKFVDKNFFGKFDLVTDFCACGHAFNIGEAYRTIHNLCKVNGLIIGVLPLWKGNAFYTYDHHFYEGLAASNNYSITYNSYIVNTGKQTKAGSEMSFHIPLNKSLLDSINLSSTKWLGVCFVLKKNTNEEFKFPYQGAYEKLKYHHYGFNKLYLQNPMSYSFVPQFSLANIKFKELIIEIIKRLKKKFKLIK